MPANLFGIVGIVGDSRKPVDALQSRVRSKLFQIGNAERPHVEPLRGDADALTCAVGRVVQVKTIYQKSYALRLTPPKKSLRASSPEGADGPPLPRDSCPPGMNHPHYTLLSRRVN